MLLQNMDNKRTIESTILKYSPTSHNGLATVNYNCYTQNIPQN